MKKYYTRLPFWFKLWWANQLRYMFKGLGPHLPDDIVLYNELTAWVETKGKPTTSSEGYKIRKRIEILEKELDLMTNLDPRDAYERSAILKEISQLQAKLHGF